MGITLRQAARDYCWLLDQRAGKSVAEIARAERVSEHAVKRGLARARELDARAAPPPAGARNAPRLVPLFPIVPLVPHATCPHNGPIARGSNLCCMVCHQSGLDHLSALQVDPRAAPAPEPKPPKPDADTDKRTRKQRRKSLNVRPLAPRPA